MLKNVMKKKLNKKGFTLAELLVVVAILAILVAVSIPIFTSQIDKARRSTDLANVRAAKAAAASKYLSEEASGEFCYDAAAGELKPGATPTGIKAYGQSSKALTEVSGVTGEPKGKVLKVTIADTDGEVTMKWVTP